MIPVAPHQLCGIGSCWTFEIAVTSRLIRIYRGNPPPTSLAHPHHLHTLPKSHRRPSSNIMVWTSIFGRGGRLRAAVYVTCLAAFLFFGYDQGVFGGLLENPDWQQQFGHPRPVIVGITVSSYCLGALFGCILNIAIGDIYGRRKMIWLAMALIIVGATLQTSAFSLGHLIVGRVITGLGTGIDSSTVPMYQSELSKKTNRGQVVAWEIWFIGVGISLAYWIVSPNPSSSLCRVFIANETTRTMDSLISKVASHGEHLSAFN